MQGEVIAGRYELLELIGKGGMSSVYKAHDRLLDRQIAVKILHPHFTEDEEYVERFRREARAVAQLATRGTAVDRGEDEGRQFIVFEYVEGENLKQRLERTGPMAVRDALLLALQMARALAFAHGRGLIHRDVKPQNALLNADGQAKMTDFGIARSVDVQGVTITVIVLGTSEYIAPEQARGQRVDAQTDVYSLGVVLYELLVGGVPYEGETFVTVALKHVNEPVPPVLERRPDLSGGAGGRAGDGEVAGRPRSPLHAGARRRARDLPRRARPRRRTGDDDLDDGRLQRSRPAASSRRIAGHLGRSPPCWPCSPSRPGRAWRAGASGRRRRSAGAYTSDPADGHLAYDSDGDDSEHDDEAGLATDGDLSTFWQTESYRSGLQKFGVGLVLDAGDTVEPRTM